MLRNHPYIAMMRLRLLLALSAAPFAAAQPTVNGIFNATGYQPRLTPNVVFVVFGGRMGPDLIAIGAGPNYPSSLGGTSISFTPAAGGAAIAPRLVYSIAGQVAGILPSSIAPGAYAVRITYNGQTSAPFNVTVVARSFGIATANSAGAGPAQATIANVNGGLSLVRFTTGSVTFNGFEYRLTPAHGGDTLVLWGTGGGADAANDAGGTSGDQTAAGNFVVIVNGRRITPLYAGASSGFPGLWQINFTLPIDIAPDCYAQLQVSAGGELSNLVTIAIAPAGAASCSDPDTEESLLARLDAGGNVTGAAFGAITSSNVGVIQELEFVNGGFFQWTGAEWAIGAPLRPRRGQCSVYDRVIPTNGADPAGPGRQLDAGMRLPLTGPRIPPGAALGALSLPNGPVYTFNATLGTIVPGRYTLAGSGGRDVGAFTAAAEFPAAFAVAGLNTLNTVDRSQPLTFNWTQAGITDVIILLNSVAQAAGGSRSVSLTCRAPGPAGTFTVGPEFLAALLPAPATSGVTLTGQSEPGTFRAPLTAGGQLDFGSFGGGIAVSRAFVVR